MNSRCCPTANAASRSTSCVSPRPKMLLCPLLGLLVAAAGCSVQQPVSRKQKEVPPTPVQTVSVTETQVQRTTLQPATVHAYYQAEIRSRASGYVKDVQADIGDVVQAGATLAVIDVPELQKQRQVIEARIVRLQAEEQRAEAGIELSAAGVRSSEAKLAETRSGLDQAQASLVAAEAEFDRTQDLVQRQSLQDRLLDEARKKRDAQQASREAMDSAVESAKAQIAVAEAQRSTAAADLQTAQAETEIARRQLDEIDVLIEYATVKAPFTGVVTQRHVEPGELVRELSEVGSGKPLFVISQIDKLRVRIPVPEADAPLISPGAPVTIRLPSFADEPAITSTVTRVANSLDPSTRTMIVETELPNPDSKLLPGMFGQASIELAGATVANTLPSRAIRYEENGNAFVYVVRPDETVAIAAVTTGRDDGSVIEVLSGVEPGQYVVDAHLKRFSDGQPVSVLTESADDSASATTSPTGESD